MKFGQLKVSIRRNIFLEKLYSKYGGEASPRSFSKKSKLSISLDRFKEQQNEVLFNRFATRRKKSGLNLKYLKNEKRLLDEIKSIFRHF